MNRAALTVITICAAVMVFLTGCQQQQKLDSRRCPPLVSKQQAAAVLIKHSAGQKPLKATGTCVFKYKNEKKKMVSLSVPIRLWLIDRDKYCIYGDAMFDPKAICLAINNDTFWAYAKPMSLFMSGSSDAVIRDSQAGLFFNPAMLADFLEPIETGADVLSKARIFGGYDKLLCRSRFGRAKCVYLSGCEKNINQIDYIGRRRGESIYVNFDNYQKIDTADEFTFPRSLIFKNCPKDKCGYSMHMKLSSVKPWQPSAAQLKALFTLPDTNIFQYKHEY